MAKQRTRAALTEHERASLTRDLIKLAKKYDLAPWEFGVSLATFILAMGEHGEMALAVIEDASTEGPENE